MYHTTNHPIIGVRICNQFIAFSIVQKILHNFILQSMYITYISASVYR